MLPSLSIPVVLGVGWLLIPRGSRYNRTVFKVVGTKLGRSRFPLFQAVVARAHEKRQA
jgi:hypothetical protein